MAGRTIIIASHAVESLAPISQQAIFLDDGRVAWKGTGDDLLRSVHMAHLRTRPGTYPEDEATTSDHSSKRRTSVEVTDTECFEMEEALARTPRQLVIEETRSRGAVERKYQWENIRFNGGIFFYVVLLLLLLACALFPVAERRVLE
jgi:ABC-type multidrug transport system ATPase subunit